MKKILFIALVAVCAMGCCKKNAKCESKCCKEAAKTECCAAVADSTVVVAPAEEAPVE